MLAKIKTMLQRVVKSRLARIAFAGLALTGLFAVVNLLTVTTTNIGIEVKGNGNHVVVTRGDEAPISAVDVCAKPDTEVALVTNTVSGESHYAAKYVDDKVRYDLTWQVSGDSIAVESLKGSETRIGVEKMSPEFATCINGKPIRRVEVTH